MPVQGTPYIPSPPGLLLCEQFEGMNTSTTRTGVPDNQVYYLDGFMPLDHHNLRTLYDVGTTLYTASGTTIVFFYFVNITSTPYAVIFLANGSVVAVNVNTSAVITLLPASTINSPTQNNIGISQWGQQYIIIVANQTNGYWVWDGTAVYQSGSIGPNISITNVGSGYISAPVISLVGGSGMGAAFTASISNGSVVGVQVTNPGTGYQAGDTPTVVFTGGNTSGSGASITAGLAHHAGGSGASIQVTMVSIVSGGGAYYSYATLVSGGSGYSNSAVVGVTGGSPNITDPITASVVAGAIASITTANVIGPGWFGTYNSSVAPVASITDNGFWFINSTTIVAGGSSYSNFPVLSVVDAGTTITASPVLTASVTQPGGTITSVSIISGGQFTTSVTPTIVITDTATTAQATVTLMPYGVSGNAVETYSGHVWVVKQNLIQYSASGSVSNFATSAGGGSQVSNSSYLKIGYTRLIQSNGFLYLIADSSIDYISGVQTSGMVPTTSFTLQNAAPTIGTPYPWSVILRGQDMIFANSIGIYTIAGAQPTKISQMLDGFWGSILAFGGLGLSAAHANIFSREVWMTLSRFIDPVTRATVTKQCMWDGKRWFVSPQNMNMIYTTSQEINSVFTAYGTDGTIVAPLFNTPSTNFTKTVQSKLWGEPGGAMIAKMPGRFWAIADYYSVSAPSIVASIDAVSRDNVTGTINNTSVTYTLAGPTVPQHFVTAPQAVGQQGMLVGVTIKTNCNDMALVSVLTDEKPVQFNG